MSSASNLTTDTLGVPAPGSEKAAEHRRHIRRRASVTLASYARDAAELRDWLDMLGLPPCERPLRTSRGERNRADVYGEAGNG